MRVILCVSAMLLSTVAATSPSTEARVLGYRHLSSGGSLHAGWNVEPEMHKELGLGHSLAAWPFGPSTFDDCILEGMKGVTSDLAARAIYGSCRKKFPERPETQSKCVLRDLSQTEMQQLTATAKFIGDSFWIDLHNGNSDVEVWELAVMIRRSDTDTKRYDIKHTYGTAPFSEGKFYFDTAQPIAKWGWGIVGAVGCSIVRK